MNCIFCGTQFATADGAKVCPACERAVERLGLNMSPDRLYELAQAEREGRLVVLPPEDYTFTIRGDIALDVIIANCRRAAEKAEKSEKEVTP